MRVHVGAHLPQAVRRQYEEARVARQRPRAHRRLAEDPHLYTCHTHERMHMCIHAWGACSSMPYTYMRAVRPRSSETSTSAACRDESSMRTCVHGMHA